MTSSLMRCGFNPELYQPRMRRVVVVLFLLFARVVDMFDLHREPMLAADSLHSLSQLIDRECLSNWLKTRNWPLPGGLSDASANIAECPKFR